MMEGKPSAWRLGSLWLKPGMSGRRPQSEQLYRPELLGPCGSKCSCFYQCRAPGESPITALWKIDGLRLMQARSTWHQTVLRAGRDHLDRGFPAAANFASSAAFRRESLPF